MRAYAVTIRERNGAERVVPAPAVLPAWPNTLADQAASYFCAICPVVVNRAHVRSALRSGSTFTAGVGGTMWTVGRADQ